MAGNLPAARWTRVSRPAQICDKIPQTISMVRIPQKRKIVKPIFQFCGPDFPSANTNRLPLKRHAPIASVAAVSDRHWQSQIWRHSWRTYNALKFVIARPRRGRGNLTHQTPNSPRPACCPTGFCEIATSASGLLAMTIRGAIPFARWPVPVVSAASGPAVRSPAMVTPSGPPA